MSHQNLNQVLIRLKFKVSSMRFGARLSLQLTPSAVHRFLPRRCQHAKVLTGEASKNLKELEALKTKQSNTFEHQKCKRGHGAPTQHTQPCLSGS